VRNPETKAVSVSEARKGLAELLASLQRADGGRIVIERYGTPLAILVHPDEIKSLDAIEDRYVQLEVDRLRAEGTLDDGRRLTTEEVVKQIADADALRTLATAMERSKSRGVPAPTGTTPPALAAPTTPPTPRQAPAKGKAARRAR